MSLSVRTAAKRKAKAESMTAVETKRKCGTHSAACVACGSVVGAMRGRSRCGLTCVLVRGPRYTLRRSVRSHRAGGLRGGLTTAQRCPQAHGGQDAVAPHEVPAGAHGR